MKQSLRWAVATAAVAALVLGGVKLMPAFGAQFVNIVFEAEEVRNLSGKAFQVQKKMETASGKVSGNKVLGIPHLGNGQHPPQDTAVYKVKVPKAGIYYLWARTQWSSGCENKVDLRVQGYDKGDTKWILGNDGTYNTLHWVNLNEPGSDAPRKIKLAAGVTAFTFIAREGGIALDQILLTTDKDKTPAGIYTPTKDALVFDAPKK
jgi:hypothetical protein